MRIMSICRKTSKLRVLIISKSEAVQEA